MLLSDQIYLELKILGARLRTRKQLLICGLWELTTSEVFSLFETMHFFFENPFFEMLLNSIFIVRFFSIIKMRWFFVR